VFATRIFDRIRDFAAVFAGTAIFALATPAAANSSANADIAAPLRAAQSAKQSISGGEDEQFRSLFDRWQTFERRTDPALAAANGNASTGLTSYSVHGSAGSIPSRMPVEGVELTSNFGMRNHPVLGGRRAHKGVDLAGPVGTPVHATGDGLVSRASWYGSYGLYVAIEHGNQLQTRYAHMSRLNVAAGQWVRKGEVIGFIGSTGRSTGPHLHYEVRVLGEAVNPVPYLSGDQLAEASSDTELGQGGP